MFLILCSSFLLLIAGVYLQTFPESKVNDCPRFDYEYKLLERLLRIEFAQRESDATIEQLHEKLKHLQTDIIQREEIQRLIDNKAYGFGSTFVRWGRTICSGNGTELVYKGFAGGSPHTYTGSAADFLCLTEAPITGRTIFGSGETQLVDGSKYEIGGSNPFFTVSSNDLVPCCVCKTSRTATLMIPGRTECYPGWTMEYTGYLMSGYIGHAGATNYVCVDADPEARPGRSINDQGHHLFLVLAGCGSLPCPPYIPGGILTCVVCSK